MAALSFTRSMRWNSSAAFSRPVRWAAGAARLHSPPILLCWTPSRWKRISCQQHADSHAPVAKHCCCTALIPSAALMSHSSAWVSSRVHENGAMAATWKLIVQATVILAAQQSTTHPPHPAGSTTQGLRNSPDSRSYTCALDVASASAYSAALEQAQILLGVEQRAEAIWRDTLAAAAEVGGTVPGSARDDLLQEVTHLVGVAQGAARPVQRRLPQTAQVWQHCSCCSTDSVPSKKTETLRCVSCPRPHQHAEPFLC